MNGQTDKLTTRRRVHYFSGFDPRGAGWYHRLCREQGNKLQPLGGQVHTGPRTKGAGHTHLWQVEWRNDAPDNQPQQTQTEHVFMGWDDLVRQHWAREPRRLAWMWLVIYWNPLALVNLQHAWRTYPPAFWTGLWPGLFVVVTLLLAAGLGGLLGWLAALWWPGPAWVDRIGPTVLGLVTAAVVLYSMASLARKAGVFWLMRTYAFNMRLGQRPIPELHERQRDWVEQIIARQTLDPVDEVLLVGHSVGTLVMVEAVDRLLNDPRWQSLQQGKPTSMLTLGHCYPFVALAPQAQAFRQSLEHLCQHPQLQWWDVTARIDPLCFYQVHPLAGTGVIAPTHAQPATTAAQFFRMYEPANWAQIKHNKLRAHFLYLMTPDKPGNFHFHHVLYGPRPFATHLPPVAHAPN